MNKEKKKNRNPTYYLKYSNLWGKRDLRRYLIFSNLAVLINGNNGINLLKGKLIVNKSARKLVEIIKNIKWELL